MAHELRKVGLSVDRQAPLTVLYDGIVVGTYRADLVVDGAIVVEVKAANSFEPSHQAQLLNYLKAAGLKIGLLFNFGTP